MTTPMTFEQFQAEQAAYQQYLATQTATPVAPMAITETPKAPPVIVASTPAPVVVAPAAPVVVAPAAPVVATVTPTAEIIIPLTELSSDRPKKAGFFRYVDGRPGLPSGFDHKLEAMRMSKAYISPLWSAGRENNLEMVIRERPQPGFAWVLTEVRPPAS